MSDDPTIGEVRLLLLALSIALYSVSLRLPRLHAHLNELSTRCAPLRTASVWRQRSAVQKGGTDLRESRGRTARSARLGCHLRA